MLKNKEASLSSLGSDGNASFLRAARAGDLDKVLENLKSNIDINTSNSNGLNALHLASKDGHVDIVSELLKRGAVVDAATRKGNTALHISSLAGQEEVVRLLVQHGASVNVQSQNGFTPLYMAAQENHDNVVKYLLSNGANQSLATEDGFTPLAVAMQQGHDKVVAVLLESDTRGKVRLPALHIAAKKDDVKAAKLLLENEHNPDVTSKSGFTPLHIASHYGNESIANLLIQKGADVNYAAKHNITPLHVAAKWGKTNMVALLLEKGANIESKTRDGLTPLHCAARSGHEQVVDMLLERGAPISCKTKNGLAPLHMAAQGDHVDAARILLYHRAPVDEVTVDYLTALHVAAHCGHVRVAKLLLDRQADANARALNGFTPLHIACKKNRIKVVELLLKHGASISATTESGLTPLHVASFMGCMNIVIYLLQHDANPDVPTVRGETPLHLAARANQTDIIRILLRNGAQVDARAREQQTPLHIASRLGNVDIVMLLLQHGAKVDTTTKDMYTALHIAAKEGQDEVAAVLIENGASLSASTKKGFTPLHLAAKYGNIKVANLLLQKEAPVDAQGKNGVTPLHVASHYDHQNVALLLLDKGASPHATAKNGHTPLHIAAKKNQMDIANTLLEYGAKPNAESKAGFTPLHLSSQEGHVEMSSLLIEHEADANHQSKNGLTPLHLCAQEDRVPVAEILVKNGAEIDAATKGGFRPLHIASHYGQANMIKFLLANGANVKSTTSIGYTPLHQAAQQGHTNIVNILLENSAQPNAVTMNGQTPLHIAQKLGYISVIESLKVVTETTTTTTTIISTEEKYKVVAPEAMQETFMSDSEEEGGEDTMLGDHSYRYLTADEMKSLGDDSLPIDVTRDERIDSNKMVTSEEQNVLPPQAIEDGISPQYITENYIEYTKKYTPDNVDIGRHPIHIGKLHWKNFLVSFLVDARGGAMRGCRHSGVRVIVPARCAPSPTRITCRYVRPQRTPHPPPLMEGEALASRVLELGPVGAKFLGPVIIEVPHFAALRGKEREIVILRSDNGETWREHTVEASDEILNDVLNDSFEAEDLNQLDDIASGRITRIVTHDFPQYFAVVSRIRQEVHAIGPEGGMVSSTVVPQVQAVFPQGALTKKIKVGLQAQPIDPELAAKLLGHGVAVSPVVTVEPRRRKFHKAITLSMPAPRAHSQGMINQYSGSAPTLRLLCSITGGTTRAQWEDVTGSTPLTFVNDCVSFTTTVSARFWLMDCRNIGDATKMATELYKEAIHVPFMAKFVVFAKRVDPLEARLRVFCMTDDKEDKTLEHQEHFTEVAKSRDVEVLEGKPQYIEFAGNLIPITKSGEPLQFSFRAFRENRLPFSVRVKDQHAEAVGRSLFMREPKVAKGEPPQQPICILNIVLPDDIVSETVLLTDNETVKRHMFLKDNFEYYRPDPRLADMSNLLGEDWVPLASQLGLSPSEINVIKSEYPDSVAKQAQSMLRMWISQSGNKAQGDALEKALRRIGREDIIPQCLNDDDVDRIPRIPKEVLHRYEIKKDIDSIRPYSKDDVPKEDDFKERESYEIKYSAEEKTIEEQSDEEDFNKSVTERRQKIEKRLTERTIPASTQRQEIVEEITSIKRQSIVEDKIAEVEIKQKPEQTKATIPKTTTTISDLKHVTATAETAKTTKPSTQPSDVVTQIKLVQETKSDIKTTAAPVVIKKRTIETNEEILTHQPEITIDRRDSELLEGVTQRLETTRNVTSNISTTEDPKSPKTSKTPPPSPADFIFREQTASIQEWSAPGRPSKDESCPTKDVTTVQDATMQGKPKSTTKHVASSEELSLDSPNVEQQLANDLIIFDRNLLDNTNAFINSESKPEPYHELTAESILKQRPSTKYEQNVDTTNTLEKDSSRDDASKGDERKTKKGFFTTLKSIVSKSQDRSDSESESAEKKKDKKRNKKKKRKVSLEKLPPAVPERSPTKPKLPTPTDERKEFANIPYVESLPADRVAFDECTNNLQTTDLDVETEVPDSVRTTANQTVTTVISVGETIASDILNKDKASPRRKATKVTIAEEIKKTFEPTVYEKGEFQIVVAPTTEPKTKEIFAVNLDEAVDNIGKEILTSAGAIPVVDENVPIRPQRRKDHVYEDIDEPVISERPIQLILEEKPPFDIEDLKTTTTKLIQEEIYFAGWADDKYNVTNNSTPVQAIKETVPESQKLNKKHGKLFGFLVKKSSKDVDESEGEKDNKKEIIEKQDREPSKEKKLKTKKGDSFSDEETVEYKKGGFFGIFGKKTKKEDDHTEDGKEIELKSGLETAPSTVQDTESNLVVVNNKVNEKLTQETLDTNNFLLQEIHLFEDVRPATAVEAPDQLAEAELSEEEIKPKAKVMRKEKKERILLESEDESDSKRGGLRGLFGRRNKKDGKEETSKICKDDTDTNETSNILEGEKPPLKEVTAVEHTDIENKIADSGTKYVVQTEEPIQAQCSEETILNIVNTLNFLNDEITHFEDVRRIPVSEPAAMEQKITVEQKSIKSDTKPKTEKGATVSEDETTSGRKTGLFGIFGKKEKKDGGKAPRESRDKEIVLTKPSEKTEVKRSENDTSDFLGKETTLFDFMPAQTLHTESKVQSVDQTIDDQHLQTILNIASTMDFLNNEVTYFEDVRQIPVAEPTAKEEKITVDQIMTKQVKKPKEEKKRVVIQEPDGNREIGFGQKVKKDDIKELDKIVSEDTSSEEAMKQRIETTNFLRDEVTYFNDVKQVISDNRSSSVKQTQKKTEQECTSDHSNETFEVAVSIRENFSEAIRPVSPDSLHAGPPAISEGILKTMMTTANFLTNEVAYFDDVKPLNIRETQQPDSLSTTDVIKQTPNAPPEKFKNDFVETHVEKSVVQCSETAVLDMSNTLNFLNNEVTHFEDVKRVTFESNLEVGKDSVEVAVNYTPSLSKDNVDSVSDVKLLESSECTPLEKHIDKADNILVDIAGTDSFLKDEIKHFDDAKLVTVHDSSISENDDAKMKKQSEHDSTISEDGSKIKQKNGIFGIFRKKTKEEVKDVVDIIPKIKDEMPKATLSADVDEDVTEKKVALKSSSQISENILQDMKSSNAFLSDEIKHYEDVKPTSALETKIYAEKIVPDIEQKVPKLKNDIEEHASVSDDDNSKRKGGLFGIFGRKQKREEVKNINATEASKIKPEDPTDVQLLRSDAEQDAVPYTEIFINNEIKGFEDVKPATLEHKIGVEKNVVDGKVVSKEVTVEKQKNEERIGTGKEGEYKRKSGIFGTFGKKSRKEEIKSAVSVQTGAPETSKENITSDTDLSGQSQDVLNIHQANLVEGITIQTPVSDELLRVITSTNQFIDDEIKSFDDVRPIVKSSNVQVTPEPEKTKKASKHRRGKKESSESGDDSDSYKKSNFFGLFGKKEKKIDSEPQAAKSDGPEAAQNATDEVIRSEERLITKDTEFAQEKTVIKDKVKQQNKTKQDKGESGDETDGAKKVGLFAIFGKKNKTTQEKTAEERSAEAQSTTALKHVDLDKQDEDKFTLCQGKYLHKSVPESCDCRESTGVVLNHEVCRSEDIDVEQQPDLSTDTLYRDKNILQNIQDTSKFLHAEVAEFADVRPFLLKDDITCEEIKDERSHLQEEYESEVFEEKDGKLETKSERESEDIDTDQMGKPSLIESIIKNRTDTADFLNNEITRWDDAKPQISLETTEKLVIQEPMKREIVKSETPQLVESHKINDSIKASEPTDLTLEFLQKQPEPHDDVRFDGDVVETLISSVPTLDESRCVEHSLQENKTELERPKDKKKGKLFGLFSRKAEEPCEIEKLEDKADEKRERQKSPFRIFGKKSKGETSDEKSTMSEQVIQDMYETKNFLSTEVMRYSDVPFKSEVKDDEQAESEPSTTLSVQLPEELIGNINVSDDVLEKPQRTTDIVGDLQSELTRIVSEPEIEQIRDVVNGLSTVELSKTETTTKSKDLFAADIGKHGDERMPLSTENSEITFSVDKLQQEKDTLEFVTTTGIEFSPERLTVLDADPALQTTCLDLTEDNQYDNKHDVMATKQGENIFSELKDPQAIIKGSSEIVQLPITLAQDTTYISTIYAEVTIDPMKDSLSTQPEKSSEIHDKVSDYTSNLVDNLSQDAAENIENVIRDDVQQGIEKLSKANAQNIKKVESETSASDSVSGFLRKEISDASGAIGAVISTEVKDIADKLTKIEVPVETITDMDNAKLESFADTADTSTKETKKSAKKKSKKSGRFFSKIGDKLSGKSKEIQDDVTETKETCEGIVKSVTAQISEDVGKVTHKTDLQGTKQIRTSAEDLAQQSTDTLARTAFNIETEAKLISDQLTENAHSTGKAASEEIKSAGELTRKQAEVIKATSETLFDTCFDSISSSSKELKDSISATAESTKQINVNFECIKDITGDRVNKLDDLMSAKVEDMDTIAQSTVTEIAENLPQVAKHADSTVGKLDDGKLQEQIFHQEIKEDGNIRENEARAQLICEMENGPFRTVIDTADTRDETISKVHDATLDRSMIQLSDRTGISDFILHEKSAFQENAAVSKPAEYKPVGECSSESVSVPSEPITTAELKSTLSDRIVTDYPETERIKEQIETCIQDEVQQGAVQSKDTVTPKVAIGLKPLNLPSETQSYEDVVVGLIPAKSDGKSCAVADANDSQCVQVKIDSTLEWISDQEKKIQENKFAHKDFTVIGPKQDTTDNDLKWNKVTDTSHSTARMAAKAEDKLETDEAPEETYLDLQTEARKSATPSEESLAEILSKDIKLVSEGNDESNQSEESMIMSQSSISESSKTGSYTGVKIDSMVTPVVTSPALPRRAASQRYTRDEIPYFVDVSNLPYDDSSSDESYIITEPADIVSTRISSGGLSPGVQPKRKPLFHLDSEDSFDYTTSQRSSIKSNVLENLNERPLETLVTDLDDFQDSSPIGSRFMSSIVFESDPEVNIITTAEVEADIIEQKLIDIEKALGSLEKADLKSSEAQSRCGKSERKLKRVERKFERMASEIIDRDVAEEVPKLSTPEIEKKQESDFLRVVSQLSTEEMTDFQKEYSALWDEQSFSPSEELDSFKSPHSQTDVLELPQGDSAEVLQKTDQQPDPTPTPLKAETDETYNRGDTEGQGIQRHVADQHMLSDEMKALLQELERETKK